MFYCVANMPGAVPHTSTYALTNVTLPYALELANRGWREALRADPALAKGLNTHGGSGHVRSGRRGARHAAPRPRGRPQLTPLEKAVQAYLDHLAVERALAANTLAAYRRDLGPLRRAGSRRPGSTISTAVGAGAVAAHIAALRAGGTPGAAPLSAASAARAASAVRGLHRFAVREGLADADPTADVKPPRLPKRLPKALDLDQVERLLAAVAGDDAARRCADRALLEVLYGTGARISEAVGLAVDDLDDRRPSRCAARAGGPDWCRSAATRAAALDAYLVRGRPALAAAGRGQPGGVPQPPRRAAVPAERLDGAAPGGRRRRAAGRGRARRVAAHAAALVRHPPARRRRGHPGGPGVARARLGDHDPGVHAGDRRPAARGVRGVAPARPRLTAVTVEEFVTDRSEARRARRWRRYAVPVAAALVVATALVVTLVARSRPAPPDRAPGAIPGAGPGTGPAAPLVVPPVPLGYRPTWLPPGWTEVDRLVPTTPSAPGRVIRQWTSGAADARAGVATISLDVRAPLAAAGPGGVAGEPVDIGGSAGRLYGPHNGGTRIDWQRR